jgi:diaminopimelate epimerase
VHLTKHHGLGNDFLVALDATAGVPLPDDPEVLAGLARVLCDRRRGIGADGLIVGRLGDAPEGADVAMALRNADGSRAEISGNGIRCLGQAVVAARGVDRGNVVVATDAGRREVSVVPGADPREVQVEVAMGEVSVVGEVPAMATVLLDGRAHRYLAVGNPHLVVEVPDPAAVDLATEGHALEAAFEGGVNVEFVRVVDDGDAGAPVIELRVWERGAGITEACGSGACAAAHAARSWGRVGDDARVAMPGGAATVHLAGDEAVLTGPSVHIARIEVPDDLVLGAGGPR